MSQQNEPMSREAKVTIGAGSVAAITVLLDVLKDSQSKFSEAFLIQMMWCVTVIIVGFQLSRGLAKYEYRGLPPGQMPPPEHLPPGSQPPPRQQ